MGFGQAPDDPVKNGTPPVVVGFPDDGENLCTKQEIRRLKTSRTYSRYET
jgi:hypothetical protein